MVKAASIVLSIAVLLIFGFPNSAIAIDYFISADAVRERTGEVIIEGKTNLPDGLKIGIDLYNHGRTAASDWSVVITGGQFRSQGFTNHSKPYPPGNYKIHFTSIFNEMWQTPEILRTVGEGGPNLSGRLFKLSDPDVVDSEKQLDYLLTVSFGPLSAEAEAIDLVRKAVLVVNGERSSGSVEETIKDFETVPEIKEAHGWTAERKGDDYLVYYDFIDGKLGEKRDLVSRPQNPQGTLHEQKCKKL